MTRLDPEGAFKLDEAIQALEASPSSLSALLTGVPESWLDFQEDPDAWSPRTVLVHFIHNEQTNWLPRANVILSNEEARTFPPFHQLPLEQDTPDGDTDQLLAQFAQLREQSVSALRDLDLKPTDLDRQGEHPVLGPVTLRQLISTWVVHDLNHLHQIAKSLAKRYGDEVGPWRSNLAILDL